MLQFFFPYDFAGSRDNFARLGTPSSHLCCPSETPSNCSRPDLDEGVCSSPTRVCIPVVAGGVWTMNLYFITFQTPGEGKF